MLFLTPKGISVKSYRPTKPLINSYATVITSTLTSPNPHISIPKMPSLRKLHLLALPFLLLLLPLPFLRPSPPLTPHRHFLSLSVAANFSIATHLRTLTRRPHLAGTPAAAAPAAYVLSHFRRSGLQAHTREYSPLLSYPAAASLSLHHSNLSLIKPLSLAEPADPAAVSVAPYHAYSPSGAALAPAVFVNYGTTKDYLTLRRLGIDLRGCIVVARGGVGYRGAVVERAAENGAAAVLIFGDAAGGVERGKVTLRGVGDPLTPGWAAAAAAGGSERLQVEDDEVKGVFQKIPSMPVAAATAAEILETLGGPAVPAEWQDGLLMTVGGVGGRGGEATLVNFTYQDDRRMGTIQDVFGVIKGCEEPDRYVILGNHRDAWTYGAVDPNSGTAALLDVAHRFGVLLKSRWRPRRTIILCSWDAEEFGMIGSTEWVEQNVGILGSNAVAYINVDCAVQGPGFFAGATPQLDKLLLEITKQIKDPDAEGMSVYQTWIARNGGTRIERLARADSDFSAFLHHVGVPSIDLYFGEAFPGYHTSFDSYKWMVEHGDPLFHRHVAMAEIWGLLAIRLADDPVLPFDFLSYAVQLQEHTNALRDLLDGDELLKPVNASIHKLMDAANVAQGEAKKLQEQQNSEDFRELTQRAFNDRMILTERGFLEAEGLRGRPWFKHLLYAPPADYESKLSFFPGIADAISLTAKVAGKERQSEIRHEIWRVARAIERAADVLRGELT